MRWKPEPASGPAPWRRRWTINSDTHGEMTAKKVTELLPNEAEEKNGEQS